MPAEADSGMNFSCQHNAGMSSAGQGLPVWLFFLFLSPVTALRKVISSLPVEKPSVVEPFFDDLESKCFIYFVFYESLYQIPESVLLCTLWPDTKAFIYSFSKVNLNSAR